MAFSLLDNGLLNIILIALGIVFVVAAVIVIARKVIKAKKEAKRLREERAEEEHRLEVAEEVHEILREIRDEYLVMSRNVTYNVGPEGEIAAGRYVVKSSVEGTPNFNLRLNGFVRRINDGAVLTLGAGDTICPVAESVLIKPYVDERIDTPTEG